MLFVSGKYWAAPISCAAIDWGMINEVPARKRDQYMSSSHPVPQWPLVDGVLSNVGLRSTYSL